MYISLVFSKEKFQGVLARLKIAQAGFQDLGETRSMASLNIDLAWIGDRYQALFGYCGPRYDQTFLELANPVISAISQGDAPYHTLDHTLRVMRVGQAILEGKQHYEGSVSPHDWLQFLVSLLCHDIGFVKGTLQQDSCDRHCYWDGKRNWIRIPSTATGAALAMHRVSRSQAYILTHLNHPNLDRPTIQKNIEMTRFPIPNDARYCDTASYGGLCRAADLLGQLSDPYYLKKLPLLFQEFEEIGMNLALGYETPEELKGHYPHFCWHVVYPYLRNSLRYLSVTSKGRKIVAQLYTTLCMAELTQPPNDATNSRLKRLTDETELMPWQEAGFTFT